MGRIINNKHFENLQGLIEYKNSLTPAERAMRKGEFLIVNKPNNETVFVFNSNGEVVPVAQYTGSTIGPDIISYLVEEGYTTQEYVDKSIANLIGGADEAFNTLKKLQEMILVLSSMTGTVQPTNHVTVTKSEYNRRERNGEIEDDVYYYIIEDESSGGTPSGEYDDTTGIFTITDASEDSDGYITIDGATVDSDMYIVFDGAGGGGEDSGEDPFEEPDTEGNMKVQAELSQDEQYFIFDNVSVEDGYFVGGNGGGSDSDSDNPSYVDGNITLDNATENNGTLSFSNATMNENNELIIG